tara:strand:+ start:469 stop:1632 length:1164 start_codon:yes stop_codon:yes gene_type:complete
MRKKIVILGSTGSIGKTTLNIIKKDIKNFEIVLLTTNNNIKELSKQINIYKPKNVLIFDKKKYLLFTNENSNKKMNIFNNVDDFKKKNPKKVDYTMCAISGLEGLNPILNLISLSKKIAIANKESIICGWNLIENKLKKYKTIFLPVDSEHFSIWSLINKNKTELIDKIFITASGGPFLKLSKKMMSKISPSQAIKHPNWSMGKKISIDSATMMNKIFEVIETQKIFNLSKSKIGILVHEDSYLHALVKFKNGITKLLVHDTNMEIPIFNTLYDKKNKFLKTKKLDLNKLNDLKLHYIDKKKFPVTLILDKISNQNSLFETVIVATNDELVDLFLKKKITYLQLEKYLTKFLCSNLFSKFKLKKPKNIEDIMDLNRYVRLKVRGLCI